MDEGRRYIDVGYVRLGRERDDALKDLNESENSFAGVYG